MPQWIFKTCACPLATGWRNCTAIVPDNTASESMISGVYVSVGKTALRSTWTLSIIIKEEIMKKKLQPIHPGEILLEEFMRPMGLSQYRVAVDIHVPPRRINEIVHGERGLSADTALRLGRYFAVSPQFWLNLQSRYDLEIEASKLRTRLPREVRVFAAARTSLSMPSSASLVQDVSGRGGLARRKSSR